MNKQVELLFHSGGAVFVSRRGCRYCGTILHLFKEQTFYCPKCKKSFKENFHKKLCAFDLAP